MKTFNKTMNTIVAMLVTFSVANLGVLFLDFRLEQPLGIVYVLFVLIGFTIGIKVIMDKVTSYFQSRLHLRQMLKEQFRLIGLSYQEGVRRLAEFDITVQRVGIRRAGHQILSCA